MKCFNCGYLLPDDSVFCQYCGKKTEKEIPNRAEEHITKFKENQPNNDDSIDFGLVPGMNIPGTKKSEKTPTEFVLKKVDAKTPKNEKVKHRYCSRCGSKIDNTTKVCIGCGKKYFNALKFMKFSLIAIAILAFVSSIVINVFQYKEINYLKSEIDFLNGRRDYWMDKATGTHIGLSE